MSERVIFENCYSGVDFENKVVGLLNACGFEATKTSNNDGGIDIIATSVTKPIGYTFNIQCKYYNRPLGKAPIQEVFSGTAYYNNGGFPVVITNNRVTAEARIYARKLGIEIIGDAEWQEFVQTRKANQIVNPSHHTGLFGIMLAYLVRDKDYLQTATPRKLKPITDKERLIALIESNFDEAEVYNKEMLMHQQKAVQCQEMVLKLQKEALLKNLEFG